MQRYIFNNTSLIFLIAGSLFLSKWIFSFHFFNDPIDVKIIFDAEIDGYFYFYYTKYISDLKFLDFLVSNNTSIIAGQAFSSLLLHALLLKIFGLYGFLVGEFICIFLFLLIFYKICQFFNFSNLFSFLIPLFIFCIPIIIEISFLNNISILHNFKQIYNLRYPNPLVSNLFLFLFVFFLLKFEKNYVLNLRNIITLGIILGLTFSSYYYYFVAEVITFFIFILYKEKKLILVNFKEKISLFLICLLIFLIVSSPFIFMLINAKPDYMERVGSLIINSEQKILLLSHFIGKILSLKFLSIFFINFLITFILKVKKSPYLRYKIIFDLFFISTVISPLLFIKFSPKISPLYHFNFTIFISLFLSIFFGFCFLVTSLFKDTNLFKLTSFLNPILILLLLFINFNYRYSLYSSLKSDESYTQFRKNFSIVTKEIKDKDVYDNLVTFDDRLVIWATLNNFEEIPLMSGVLTTVSNKDIEKELFSTFKLLGLNENDFLEIFRNKKSSWRFLNRYTQIYFWYRYSANSLTTYKDSIDFNKDDLAFIKNISPLHSHSIAIPNFELSRLSKDFISFKNRLNNKINYVVIFDEEMIEMIKKKFNKECYVINNKNLFFLALNNENCS